VFVVFSARRYASAICCRRVSVCVSMAAFFFSRRDYSSPKNEMTWTSLISSGVKERRKQYLVCLHWCCYSRQVNVNRLQLLAEANRSLCPKKKSWKQWLWEWPLLAWKLELNSSSSSSDHSSQRLENFAEVVVPRSWLGLEPTASA